LLQVFSSSGLGRKKNAVPTENCIRPVFEMQERYLVQLKLFETPVLRIYSIHGEIHMEYDFAC